MVDAGTNFASAGRGRERVLNRSRVARIESGCDVGASVAGLLAPPRASRGSCSALDALPIVESAGWMWPRVADDVETPLRAETQTGRARGRFPR